MNHKLVRLIKKQLIEIGDSLYYRVLERELADCKTVLDVGCGSNSPLRKIKKTFWSEGIDIYRPAIVESKKNGMHDSYKVADARKLRKLYEPKSFDAIVALDIIEHLKKEEGERLLSEMEEIAKKKIILLTPNGFYKHDSGNANPYQIHKSGWIGEELKKWGYKVYGLRGLKWLRGKYAEIKYKPWLFWGFLSFLSERIFYWFPSFSFELFAVKQP